MTGILYGVGIGPGDAELITLKAVRVIKECGVIVVPKSGDGERVALNIAMKAVPELGQKLIVELHMPMTRDQEELRQSHLKAADAIIDFLADGLGVAFLTLGDPTIYSTYIYVHRLVASRGYPAEIIPGVPSFCAVSAKLGDCLVETSQALHVIPGVYGNLKEQLMLPGTKVLMKSGKAFAEVRHTIREAGLCKYAMMIEKCGFDSERIYRNLDDADESAGYFSVIVVKEKECTSEDPS